VQAGRKLDRLFAVPRAADDLDAFVALESERQSFHEERVIVGEHDPKLRPRVRLRLRHGVDGKNPFAAQTCGTRLEITRPR
jgi:hypothetical protein